MTQEEKEKLFERLKGIAFTVASKFAMKFNIPYNVIADEAVYALGKNIYEKWERVYNPATSKETTWAYQIVYWHLKTFCTLMPPEQTMGDRDPIELTAKTNWLNALFLELSEEGTALVKTIINAPSEIAKDIAPNTCYKAREAVKTYLIDEEDWPRAKLFKAWEEVRSCL
jgi:hypothetical protein